MSNTECRMSDVGRAILAFALITAANAAAAAADLADEALATMKKATAFFTTEIATRGGYLWRYSEDLKVRYGEGKATETQVWVQPPGTPTVGLVYLRAYEAAGDKQFLDAAVAAAHALLYGQMGSGGWRYKIDFGPPGSSRDAYRHLKPPKSKKVQTLSILDDNTTQAALRLLMAIDHITQDEKIHEAVTYGLDALIKAQLPKGGWPQVFFVDPLPEQKFTTTVKIGDDGSRTEITRPTRYWYYYTYNDGVINDCIRIMLEAHERYKEPKYLASAKKAGDFIILSQLEPPQAGWAQQYTLDLKPEWARRFEPRSVCSAVTVRNIHSLIDLYLVTGDRRLLEPIPPALDWLERSKLPGKGARWARFYEIGSNRPLYMTRKYELTYKDDDLPTHYSFISNYGVDKAAARYRELEAKGRDAMLAERARKPTAADHRAAAKALATRVRSIIAALDARGRWLTKGWIECRTFNANLRTLADYVAAVKGAKGPK